jgi:uncharacterized membrane protein YidH (DUF202 family)
MVAGQRSAATTAAVVLVMVGGTLIALAALRWTPDDRDRSLSLYVEVGVTAGSVPVWQILADVGG